MNRMVKFDKVLLCQVAGMSSSVDWYDIHTALLSIESHFEGNNFGSDVLAEQVEDKKAFDIAQGIWDIMEAEIDRDLELEDQAEADKIIIRSEAWEVEQILSAQDENVNWQDME